MVHEDPGDARVHQVGAVTEGGAVPTALELVVVAVRGELRDLADSPGRRLDVLRERDGMNRHGDRGEEVARVVVQAGLPLSGEHGAVAMFEVGGDEPSEPFPQFVVAEYLGGVVEEA